MSSCVPDCSWQWLQLQCRLKPAVLEVRLANDRLLGVTGPWMVWLHWWINLMEWLGSGRELWGPAKMEEIGHWGHAFEGYLLSPVPLCFLSARKWPAILGHILPSWHTDTTGPEASNRPKWLWTEAVSQIISFLLYHLSYFSEQKKSNTGIK